MGCSQGCVGPKKRQPEKPKAPVKAKSPKSEPAVVEVNPMDQLLSSNTAPS